MIIDRAPSFKKAYKKRIATNPQLITKVDQRLMLFIENPFHPLLRNHPLTGGKRGYRAFSITGDIRIIYQQVDEQRVRFIDIGTHNQVY